MSRVLILMYHQVDVPVSAREQRFCTPPVEFRAQMAWLADAGYRMIGIEGILGHVSGNTNLSSNAVHVTFDDGFVGVLEHALPVLKQYGIPATLYALPDREGKTNEWMSRRGFPQRALLSKEQLRLLAEEGVTIGSHTSSHPRLTEVSSAVAEREIAVSKTKLEDMLGRPVGHFAYPYGLFDQTVRDMVIQAGYHSACSTRSGFNRPGEDRFLLRRIDVFGTDRLWQFRQKLQFGTNEATWLRPLVYYATRVGARFGRK